MSLFILFSLRHKATGEIMPLLRRDRGYSHWNPSNPINSIDKKSKGVPRLFLSRRNATTARALWATMPNSEMRGYTNHLGEGDYDIVSKEDGRTKDDLEIIEVTVEEKI